MDTSQHVKLVLEAPRSTYWTKPNKLTLGVLQRALGVVRSVNDITRHRRNGMFPIRCNKPSLHTSFGHAQAETDTRPVHALTREAHRAVSSNTDGPSPVLFTHHHPAQSGASSAPNRNMNENLGPQCEASPSGSPTTTPAPQSSRRHLRTTLQVSRARLPTWERRLINSTNHTLVTYATLTLDDGPQGEPRA